MDTAELIRLVSAGPNAVLVANVAGDASWNVAADWGFGSDWQAVRVPVGIKFRRSTNGLVSEEVLIIRGRAADRAAHEQLLSRSRVPAHLVMVDRPHAAHNRLAPHFHYPQVASDS
jgi:hypothetical protein